MLVEPQDETYFKELRKFFLTEDQAGRYGRFAGEPTHDQLDRHFHHDDADRAFVAEHRPPPTRGGSRLPKLAYALDSLV